MTTTNLKEVSAREAYNKVEADIWAAINMATFLAHALDSMPDMDFVEAQGAAVAVTAIRDRVQAVKDSLLASESVTI